MQLIKCKIEGVTPMLCNRFTDAAALKATAGSSAAFSGSKGSPLEQATPKLYTDDAGVIGIPQPNIFSCLIAGGKFFKVGKTKVTTQKTSVLCACVDMKGIFVPLKHKDPWTIDERAVRNPATGGRFLCYRPKFNDWALAFDMELDDSMMDAKLLREIVDAAGKRVGLGDFRPDCKGPFGKFSVTHWDVKKSA